MWLAVECKWAYMVPYYNSFICYCHHFEHLFLPDQINFNVCILILCLLSYIDILYLFIVQLVLLFVGVERLGGGIFC